MGIGTSSPTQKLEVDGTVKATKFIGDGSELTGISSGGSGDITGVTAGTGLSGGGDSADVTLNVDTTEIQKRVTGTCTAGSSIREIKADGTVTCETDDEGSGGTSLWTESGANVYRSSGNVGIGTVSPEQKLHVAGKGLFEKTSAGELRVDLKNISRTWKIVSDDSPDMFHIYDGGNAAYRFSIDNIGNIGIGTENPAAKLDVNGTIRAPELCDETGSNCKDISGGWDSGGDASYASSASSPSDAVYVDNSGNVGIGTTSPSTGGGYNRTLNIHSTDTAGLVFSDNTKEYSIGLNAQDSLDFYDVTNGAHRILIDTTGNVGIGTTSPIAKLDIKGTDNNQALAIKGTNGENTIIAYPYDNYGRLDFFNSGTRTIRIVGNGDTFFNNGNVGIGTTSPNCKLEVDGNIGYNTATCSSDRRWKTNIQPLTNSLEKVTQLQGVSYDWNQEDYPEKNFGDEKQIGLIAQEVEKVIPELVKTDNDGYKSLSYVKLTAVLVEAVKEQQEQLEDKQYQIDALKDIVCLDHPEAEMCQ